jgi:hypothetical protein
VIDRSCNARSGVERKYAASTGSSAPSSNVTRPSIRKALRRSLRTGVDSTRCAAERHAHATDAATAAAETDPVCAKYPVSAGKAPQPSANHRSLWNAPPRSSRL